MNYLYITDNQESLLNFLHVSTSPAGSSVKFFALLFQQELLFNSCMFFFLKQDINMFQWEIECVTVSLNDCQHVQKGMEISKYYNAPLGIWNWIYIHIFVRHLQGILYNTLVEEERTVCWRKMDKTSSYLVKTIRVFVL